MDSKKRFIDNFLWDTPFFQELNANEKLFFIYLNNKCDNIGYWQPNIKLAKFHVGEFNEEKFLGKVNHRKERIKILDDGAWFLTDFVKFQFASSKPLHPKNPAHKSYLKLMHERNLYDWFKKNQPEVLPSSGDKKKDL